MQLIITDAWLIKSRAIHLSGTKLLLSMLLAAFVLMLVAAGLYHWVFLKGAREGWPVIGSLVRLVVKDEFEQRDRFLRENIEVMAKKLGEMQAKMLQLESLGERIPWDFVSKAQWDEPMLAVVALDGAGQPSRLVSVRLDQANGVPAAVHAQVVQSVIASERIDLGDGAGAVAVARRSLDSDSIWWSVVFDSGLDHADPALRMRADAALGALRDSLGV